MVIGQNVSILVDKKPAASATAVSLSIFELKKSVDLHNDVLVPIENLNAVKVLNLLRANALHGIAFRRRWCRFLSTGGSKAQQPDERNALHNASLLNNY